MPGGRSGSERAPPPGFARLVVGRAEGVCLAALAPAVAEAVGREGTLYAYAARHPARRAFAGRAPTYAAPLPDGGPTVVVRHAWHGGLLRRLTRDLYAPPTRAPRELRLSEWLRGAGVRTPRVAAYVRYPAPLGLRRVDVATHFVEGGRDLAAVLGPDPDPAAAALRAGWLEATAELVAALSRLGVHHPDLNLKNVLLAPDPDTGTAVAWALDVDVARVLGRPPSERDVERAYVGNVARLNRSVRKWQARGALRVDVGELNALSARIVELSLPGANVLHVFVRGA